MSTAQMNRRRAHLSSTRATILDALINQPEPCTVVALAGQIGKHLNTVREHLDKLSDCGLVVRTQALSHGRGRPPWLYKAAREVGSDHVAREYAALACVLASHIVKASADPGADAIVAGRMRGREIVRDSQPSQSEVSGPAASPSAVATRRTVVTLLEALGFAPSTDARVSVVKLHRCPFLEAAYRNPQVVCSVHVGLVRGALDELGADPERTENIALQPFSEPGACRLEMVPRFRTTQ